MFIVINFGYKLTKIFTIDCLAATLFDCIWVTCFKELLRVYTAKEQLFNKESENHKKRIEKNQKRLEELEVKIKEEQDANPNLKKEDKKAAKKGAKDQPIASSPLEQEKFDLIKQNEESKVAITKYSQKLVKLKELTLKANTLNEKLTKELLFLELVDKTGQRKFIKSKLNNEANTFLTDKTTYILCTISNTEEEEVEPLVIDGFAVRTVEEDQTVGTEEVFSLIKKDDKNKKGAKKK